MEGITWLMADGTSGGPLSGKFRTWSHAVTACMVYYATVCIVGTWGVVGVTSPTGLAPLPSMGWVLWGYVGIMVVSRVPVKGSLVFYELMWGCNVALVLAGYGAFVGHAGLISASLVSVCVDQVMWYVDVGAWVAGYGFPIGVAKYITHPDTGNIQLATSGHHLAFIPCCLAMMGEFAFPQGTFAASVWLLVLEGIGARLLSPAVLNINLSRSCWKDVPFSLLHLADNAPFLPAMAWLVFVWSSTNALCYSFLCLVHSVLY